MADVTIENGKMDLMGINIDISQILGQKIIDQYIAQLTDKDMATIMDFISADFFVKKKEHIFDYDTAQYNTQTIAYVKTREKDQWGSYRSNNPTIGELIQQQFNNRIREELTKKVEEIIATTDYKEKIEQIANELVEYSINGYKEDMKNRIRERLVGNVMENTPYYGGIDLRTLINVELDKRMGG
jgi:hypothetical protein